MNAFMVAGVVFCCLVAASFGVMHYGPRLPQRLRDDDTNVVVRLVANLFVVTTSLVFGLMINSSRGTFETIDRNVHAYAADLILLDRTLRDFGPEADGVRTQLIAFVEQEIVSPVRSAEVLNQPPTRAARELEKLGNAMRAMEATDGHEEALLADIRQQYRRIVQQRWAIVEQSDGSIPMPLIYMLGAWLTLIFATLGYRAPPNATITTMFLVAAGLLGGSIYLVLDMDAPFSGPIQISDAPLERALASLRLP